MRAISKRFKDKELTYKAVYKFSCLLYYFTDMFLLLQSHDLKYEFNLDIPKAYKMNFLELGLRKLLGALLTDALDGTHTMTHLRVLIVGRLTRHPNGVSICPSTLLTCIMCLFFYY